MRWSRPWKELRQAVDLLDRVGAAQLERRGLGGVDRLDLVDQALQRPEPALEHPQVRAERQDDRERDDHELPALVGRAEVEARGDAGGEQREREQHHIGRNDLAYEGVVAAGHAWSVH